MQTITKYQAKYFAHYLTRRLPANDLGKLTASLRCAGRFNTPSHRRSTICAFKSPLSNGAILADEVGLGKTIEAGIILSQHWAEHKRKLLIIAPANLRAMVERITGKVLPAIHYLGNQKFQRRNKQGKPESV